MTVPIPGVPQRDGPALVHSQLCDAAEKVPGLRVYRRPGASVSPPGVYVQPPSLTWSAYENQFANEAVFEVVLVVAADERAMANLFQFLPILCQELDDSEANAVVMSAEPGVWRVGTIELPAYFIRVEVAL